MRWVTVKNFKYEEVNKMRNMLDAEKMLYVSSCAIIYFMRHTNSTIFLFAIGKHIATLSESGSLERGTESLFRINNGFGVMMVPYLPSSNQGYYSTCVLKMVW